MQRARVGIGQLVAGACAVGLLVAMFLPWYEVSASVAGFGGERDSAWSAFTLLDLLLAVLAIAVLATVVAQLLGRVPARVSGDPALVVACLGGLLVALLLLALIDAPVGGPEAIRSSVDVTRLFGLFAALAFALGVAFGGFAAAAPQPGAEAPARS